MDPQQADEQIILLEKDSTIFVESKLSCPVCNKLLLNQKTLVRHIKQAHGIRPAQTGSTECPVEGCSSLFPSVNKVRDHLASNHNLPQPFETKMFVNFEAFLKWKADEESRTASSYVKTSSSAAIHSRPGAFKARYRCHRSGKYKSHGTGKKTIKSQKSCKMGRVCPAGMEVVTSPSPDCSVSVTLWPNHYGHKQDLGHLWLSTKERNAIAVKISQGRTFDEILDEIRRDVDGGISRLHLVKRKDLHNIMHAYNLKGMTATSPAAAITQPTALAECADSSNAADAGHNSRVSLGRGQFTDNEVVDVAQWVTHMQQLGDESPVLLYHDPTAATTSERGVAPHDEFILVVMTSAQRQVLLRFGQDRVCLDVMQRATPDQFSLTVLLVLDECGHALPAGFCFSAEADECSVSTFLGAVRNRVGPVHCRTFLSNATPLCYDAWLAAMESPPVYLLPCMWHMDRSWRQKIAQTVTGSDAVRDRTYVALRSLLRSKDALPERQAEFVAELLSDSNTHAFGHYFQTTYVGLLESWGASGGVAGASTTPIGAKNEYTRLAAYHKICRHIYSNNRRFTDLDACLSALLRKARDKIFERLTKLATDAVETRPSAVVRRHQRGALISSADLTVVQEGQQWRVFDRNTSSEWNVFKEGDSCPDCELREHCDDCRADLCPHIFLCTCDNACMCEHVHAVVSNFVFMRPVPAAAQSPNNSVSTAAEQIDDAAGDREEEMRALSVAVADAVPQNIVISTTTMAATSGATSAPADHQLMMTTGSRLNLLTCLMQREGRNAPDADTLREVNVLLDRCVSLLKDKPVIGYKRHVMSHQSAESSSTLTEPSSAKRTRRKVAGKRLEPIPVELNPQLPPPPTSPVVVEATSAPPPDEDVVVNPNYEVIGVCDQEGASAVVSIQDVRTLLVGGLGEGEGVDQGEFNSFHLDGEQIIKICYAIPSDHCYC